MKKMSDHLDISDPGTITSWFCRYTGGGIPLPTFFLHASPPLPPPPLQAFPYLLIMRPITLPKTYSEALCLSLS